MKRKINMLHKIQDFIVQSWVTHVQQLTIICYQMVIVTTELQAPDNARVRTSIYLTSL